MIHLLVGENAYAMAQQLATFRRDAKDADIREIDGEKANLSDLADAVRGGTLFAARQLIIIRDLSRNKAVWEKLAEWVTEVPADTTIVLLEKSVDKRTKIYKTIASHARVTQVNQWTDRDTHKAEEWVDVIAKHAGVKLSLGQVRDMVRRATIASEVSRGFVIDQMMLHRAMRSLSALEAVSDEAIATVLPSGAGEAVYGLIEYAVQGRERDTHELLESLRHHEDPYVVLNLLMSQWFQIIAIRAASPGDNPATDFGIHPFVASKLGQLAKTISSDEARKLSALCAEVDAEVKSANVAPWSMVDRVVFAILYRNK